MAEKSIVDSINKGHISWVDGKKKIRAKLLAKMDMENDIVVEELKKAESDLKQRDNNKLVRNMLIVELTKESKILKETIELKRRELDNAINDNRLKRKYLKELLAEKFSDTGLTRQERRQFSKLRDESWRPEYLSVIPVVLCFLLIIECCL